MRESRAQSAVEFLTTYSWALIIIIGAIALVYLFFNSILSTVPSTCGFPSVVQCGDIALSSNTAASSFQVLIINEQQYSVKNPTLYINVSGSQNIHGSCGPSFVLPGGSVICSFTGTPLPVTDYVGGFLIYNQSVCTQEGTASCTLSIKESFNGTFTAHVQPFSGFPQCAITLQATNTISVHGGTGTTLVSNVMISGTPIPGATVAFTSNAATSLVSPPYILTNVNGTAMVSLTDSAAGSVYVTANFLSGCGASNTITFS